MATPQQSNPPSGAPGPASWLARALRSAAADCDPDLRRWALTLADSAERAAATAPRQSQTGGAK
jgi:hypothetical protein